MFLSEWRSGRGLHDAEPGEVSVLLGRFFGVGTGWLIRGSDTFRTGFGPVSDRFQTSVRPVPDQCLLPHAQSRSHVTVSPPPSTVHVIMSCQICGVMSDAQCHFGCTGALTEIHESSLKVVQCWYGTGSLVFSLCVPSPGEAPAFHGARGNRFLSACRAGLLPAMLGAQLGAKNISFQSHPRPIFMYLPMYPYPMYLWRISCVSHVTVCYVNV